jgi:hypothetical protein
MTTDCPQCGSDQPPAAKACHCGFVFASKDPTQEDMAAAKDRDESHPLLRLSLRDKLFSLRLIIGGSGGVICGILLLIWELSSSPVTVWGIIHPILLIIACLGVIGFGIWLSRVL